MHRVAWDRTAVTTTRVHRPGVCAQACYQYNGTYLFPQVKARHQENLRWTMDFSAGAMIGWLDRSGWGREDAGMSKRPIRTTQTASHWGVYRVETDEATDEVVSTTGVPFDPDPLADPG
jgi:protein gp88